MTEVDWSLKPTSDPPDPDKPYIWLNGQWFLVATDTSDGVPDKLDFPKPKQKDERARHRAMQLLPEVRKFNPAQLRDPHSGEWIKGIKGEHLTKVSELVRGFVQRDDVDHTIKAHVQNAVTLAEVGDQEFGDTPMELLAARLRNLANTGISSKTKNREATRGALLELAAKIEKIKSAAEIKKFHVEASTFPFQRSSERHLPGKHNQLSHASRGGRAFDTRVRRAVDDGQAVVATHTEPLGSPATALYDYGRPETEFVPGELPHYVRVNGALRTNRGGPLGDPDAERVQAGLDEAFQRDAPRLGKELLVTRGVRDMNLTFAGQTPKVGMTWLDHGYTSTTSREATDANRFLDPRGANLRIVVPKGVRAMSNGKLIDEGEILLERGLKFRVVADHGPDPNGVRQLDVEVLRP